MAYEAFTEWSEQLFNESMRRAAYLLEEACDNSLLKIYRDLDFQTRFQGLQSANDVANQLGYAETADIAIDAMLWRLARHTHVVNAHDGNPVRYDGWQLAPDPTDRLESIATELTALGRDYEAPLEFLAFGTEKFAYALGEDPEFMDRILSAREPEFAKLWHRATNVDPLQDVHGIMGGEFITRTFDGGTILEIGGGTGNGTRNLLRRLAEDDGVGRIERYVFTDISLRFILETRKEISIDYPELPTDWKHVDINKPLTAQKIEPESVDLIFAVNAAHVARDLVSFLKECRTCLRTGGRIVFAERVREDPRMMAPRELALNLSIYHRTAAERNTDYRFTHCYLTRENWHRAIELAGFEQAETPPDPARLSAILPNAYAAIVTAQKG